jgi:hypothetical protein
VVEIADAVGDAAAAQFGAERDEVVVVDPDHVVGLAAARTSALGEAPVDAEIAGI